MFSIIIPVYNEERIIEKNISKLTKHLEGKDFEIIIANNGSDDETLKIANRISKYDSRVKVVSIENKAPGLAFKMGAKSASGEIIISQDMDLSTDLRFINQSTQLMKSNDLVIGSKRMGNQNRAFLRKIPSSIFIFLTKLLLNVEYEDYSMAAKSYKKDFIIKHYDNLNDGTSYVLELIYFAKKENKRIVDIPVDCVDERKSKFNILNESLYRFRRLMWLAIFRILNK